ncbi:MAG: metallopeptidase TldD-related protein [Nanoarchaeota archaeon]
MITSRDELQDIARKGLLRISGGVRDAEVYVASNGIDTVKINFTSDIPCNGIEQPVYSEVNGCGVRLIFNDGRYGFGYESSLSVDAVAAAAAKAFASAHEDPLTRTLPQPDSRVSSLHDYHDAQIFESGGREAVELGWRAIDGLVDTYKQAGFTPKDAIILNGDLTTLREMIAIASSTGIDVTDVSTVMMAYLTTVLAAHDAKGTGWSTGGRLDTFNPEAAGRMAAESAIRTIGGHRIESGKYDIILGPQAITDLANHFLIPGVKAENFGFGLSPFTGKFGQEVISPALSVYDNPALSGLAGSKAYTCEGIPTGLTSLIDEGRLVGLLSSQNDAAAWNQDPSDDRVREHLGTVRKFLGTEHIPILGGRNGFRFSPAGGRVYMAEPSAHATNLFIAGNETVPEDSLVAALEDGIYIGRLWYTYPIRGFAQGDVTSTVIADSYIVKDGKIHCPLKPNTVRVNDNVPAMLNRVSAVGDKLHDSIVWGSESVVFAPYMIIRQVQLDNIAGYMG